MPHISITRLKLRRFWTVPAFLIAAGHCTAQARSADGFLDGYTAFEWPLAFWTVTLWREETAKRAFYRAGYHRDVMPKMARWCSEASLASRDVDTGQLPSPSSAAAIMRDTGRLSRVTRPSSAQERGLVWPSDKVPRLASGHLKPANREPAS